MPKNESKYYLKYTFLVFPVLGIFGFGTSLLDALVVLAIQHCAKQSTGLRCWMSRVHRGDDAVELNDHSLVRSKRSRYPKARRTSNVWHERSVGNALWTKPIAGLQPILRCCTFPCTAIPWFRLPSSFANPHLVHVSSPRSLCSRHILKRSDTFWSSYRWSPTIRPKLDL